MRGHFSSVNSCVKIWSYFSKTILHHWSRLACLITLQIQNLNWCFFIMWLLEDEWFPPLERIWHPPLRLNKVYQTILCSITLLVFLLNSILYTCITRNKRENHLTYQCLIWCRENVWIQMKGLRGWESS